MSDVLVRCDGVGKKFCRDLKRSLWYGVRDSAADLLGWAKDVTDSVSSNRQAVLRPGEFWANRDISFELKRGECLGLIGRNGAGKTTLLKMLTGLIKPNEGRIELRGRVGALIALGAGFNPILTGRENIYVNGAVLGFSRTQLNRLLPDIIEFAEIADAIDSPVRTYSSGMQVKLGFAIAAHLSPDLLIVDEVLAVGDAAFRRKCYDFFRTLRKKGSSVILVTHGLTQVSMIADKAIVLEQGRTDFSGEPATAVGHLLDLMENDSDTAPTGGFGFRQTESPLAIDSVHVEEASGGRTIRTGDTVRFRVHFSCEKDFERLNCQASIWLRDETTVLSLMNSSIDHFYFAAHPGSGYVDLILEDCILLPGKYF
ncbi:MAG: ABC transporter ATP-binding protein, partial [Fuerstiella sp.]|nr:ABC transporter ATP-binding protein [Fuerstiella sp.]